MELDKVSKSQKTAIEGWDLAQSIRLNNPLQIQNQQALLKKQRRAKNCLLQLDMIWQQNSASKSTNRSQVGENTINGWIDLEFELQNLIECPAVNTYNKSTLQTINSKERSVTEASRLIPHLKEELSRLESPERRQKDKLEGMRLFNLQIISQLSRKRRHSLKVSEIIRNREDRFFITSQFKKIEMPEYRPFTNAQNRLNQNKCKLKKILEIPAEARFINQQPYRVNPELDLFKQNEIKQIRHRYHSPKHLQISKDFNLSRLDHVHISRSSFYQERRKGKITLKNLLDL